MDSYIDCEIIIFWNPLNVVVEVIQWKMYYYEVIIP